jgi:hypothetical protein
MVRGSDSPVRVTIGAPVLEVEKPKALENPAMAALSQSVNAPMKSVADSLQGES